MPELPEVETVRRGLLKHIQHATIERVEVRCDQLRNPIPDQLEEVMEGATVTDISRRSKYMLWQLDNSYTMLSHLGMSGRYQLYDTLPKVYKKHEHIMWHLTDGRVLVYEDPRRFGMIDIIDPGGIYSHPLLTHLGPEPLSHAFNTRYLARMLTKRSQAIKPALMDAKLVVGIGNIYAAEACFRAGVDPHTPAQVIATLPQCCTQLTQAIKQILRDAIASGGSSLRDFWHVEGGGGYFQHRFFVYGREGETCYHCNNPIQRSKQAGRSTFYCTYCQKMAT